MKTIARILQTTGFLATLLVFSWYLDNTIDPGTCERRGIGPLEWCIPIAMLVLILGFGAVSRNELSKKVQIGFWLFSAIFFGILSSIGLFFYSLFHGFGYSLFDGYDYGSFELRWQNIVDIFTPELLLGDALSAMAAFRVDVFYCWMPAASAMSVLAFVITIFGCGKSSEQAEQDEQPTPDHDE